VVDAAGTTAVFSGAGALGLAAVAEGSDSASAGNLLGSADVPGSMIAAFSAHPEAHLGTRLVAALRAGLDAGGEAGPVRSAGLLVADDVPWPVADLRVDWHDDPVGELAKLWELWQPQLDDYRTRALRPSMAPGYGVPGDETGRRGGERPQ
jgi:uncharacterized Ntn-hydrolase superfamily protein